MADTMGYLCLTVWLLKINIWSSLGLRGGGGVLLLKHLDLISFVKYWSEECCWVKRGSRKGYLWETNLCWKPFHHQTVDQWWLWGPTFKQCIERIIVHSQHDHCDVFKSKSQWIKYWMCFVFKCVKDPVTRDDTAWDSTTLEWNGSYFSQDILICDISPVMRYS